jgi:cellulose 1,4-beta-cellobiosidase
MGCSWGICSPHSKLPHSELPARVSALHSPTTTWHTSEHASGRWDAAFDLWFGRRRMTTGQATGAEVMIWLNARDIPLASKRIVRVDGVRWYLAHWRARLGTKTWHYIQFRRVHPVWRVRNLRLNPFIRHAERRRLVSRRWWLLNIEAGFELLRGGRGLTGWKFWARA